MASMMGLSHGAVFNDLKIKRRILTQGKRFPGYVEDVDPTRITRFLAQFRPAHVEIALKMIEKVNYFGNRRTNNQLHGLVSLLNREANLSSDNVYFCSMSLSPGKSTELIIKKIRGINNMYGSEYDSKFLYLRALENLQDDRTSKTIIFVDDFIGSGGTIENLWAVLQNWYNSNHRYIIGVIVGYEKIMNYIQRETPLRIICAEEPLPESAKIFHTANNDFSSEEKEILKSYCRKVEPRKEFRYGYKNTQSLVIFYDNAPDNTIPILHSRSNEWYPIFPRLGL